MKGHLWGMPQQLADQITGFYDLFHNHPEIQKQIEKFLRSETVAGSSKDDVKSQILPGNTINLRNCAVLLYLMFQHQSNVRKNKSALPHFNEIQALKLAHAPLSNDQNKKCPDLRWTTPNMVDMYTIDWFYYLNHLPDGCSFVIRPMLTCLSA